MRISAISNALLFAGVIVSTSTAAAQTQTDKVRQLLAHTTQVVPEPHLDNGLRRYKVRGTDVDGYINPETLTPRVDRDAATRLTVGTCVTDPIAGNAGAANEAATTAASNALFICVSSHSVDESNHMKIAARKASVDYPLAGR